MKYDKDLVFIPGMEEYRITEDGRVYKADMELTNVEEVIPYFKKYKKVDLYGEPYRIDMLILRTFVGEIDLPIRYKVDDKTICELDNLEYIVDIVEKVDDDTIYVNNVANEFRRIPNNDLFISRNGMIFNPKNETFKNKKYNKNGYCMVTCMNDSNKSSRQYLHRIVYEAWKDKIPNKYVIDHIDGFKSRNYTRNLEAVSSSENNIRAYIQDLKSCRWNEYEIRTICLMMQHGKTLDDICELFDIPIEENIKRNQMRKLICDLKHDRAWPFIVKDYDFSKFDNSNFKHSVLTDEEKVIIRNLKTSYRMGSTEISRIINRNRSTVLNYMRAHDLTDSHKSCA